MSSETQVDRIKNLNKRIKLLEEKYKLSLDYEIETDDKITNLYETLKIISSRLGIDMNYDYRKANVKKLKKKSKKNKRKRKTKRKSK